MLSAIVIGRNEGERLTACMRSIREALQETYYEMIYVDAHSTDHSLERAANAGARCYLPTETRTTAALGRDIGAREARGDTLLFLDGDMTLEKGFVREAMQAIRRTACDGVCGIRHDIYVKAGQVVGENENYFGCTQERVAPEFGGALLITRAALERAGGWAADVEAGEEAELHARLNQVGARIIEIPTPMIIHTDSVQQSRGLLRTVFSRRRLGNGQAALHALRAGSFAAYIAREKALFIPCFLDVLGLLIFVAAWIGGTGALGACMLFLALQLLQAVAFILKGRPRAFVSAKLFLFALPLGMISYKRRNTAYCEWTV